MSKKIQKFFGWVLLLAGVAIISWSLYSSYRIFNNKRPSPEIFKTEAQKPEQTKKPQQGLEAQLEEKTKEIIGEQLKEVLPADAITKFFNLIAWSGLAAIFLIGGSQLAGIGIRLLRED